MGRIAFDTGKPLADNPSEVKAGKTVFHAAERSAEFYDHLRTHYRETRRTPVEIPAEIKILMGDKAVYDAGTAVIHDISPSGALLREIKLPKNTLPIQPFKFELVLKGGDYDGIGLEAVPVRFEPEHGGLGVKFQEIFVAV